MERDRCITLTHILSLALFSQERKAREALERHEHYQMCKAMWKQQDQAEHADKRMLSMQVSEHSKQAPASLQEMFVWDVVIGLTAGGKSSGSTIGREQHLPHLAPPCRSGSRRRQGAMLVQSACGRRRSRWDICIGV